MKKFYNLKLERPEVMGTVISLDPEAPLEKRLEELTGGRPITLTRYDRGIAMASYELVLDDRHLVASERTPDRLVGFCVQGGELSLTHHSPPDVPVYFSEITPEQAKKIQEDANYWRMLQAWI